MLTENLLVCDGDLNSFVKLLEHSIENLASSY